MPENLSEEKSSVDQDTICDIAQFLQQQATGFGWKLLLRENQDFCLLMIKKSPSKQEDNFA